MFRGLSEEVGAESHFGLVHPLREADAYITEPFMPSATTSDHPFYMNL